MPKDYYIQPDAPDPVLDEGTVLSLARRHVSDVKRVTGVDENGGEARTYAIDATLIFKVQRPQQLRPRTSLRKEVFFLDQLQGIAGVTVPRVLGYGRHGKTVEYTLMTRMPGIAVEYATLSGEARRQALFGLGQMLRHIHALPPAPFLDSGLFPGDHSPVDVRWRFGNLFDEVLDLVRESNMAWSFPIDPVTVSRRAMAALPDVDECVALHSNPGPEHVFVDPVTGKLTGIIDFGDAYFSHPVHDLRRWRAPEDREAVFAGYTYEHPVSENFRQTWQVAKVLVDLISIARVPVVRSAAEAELDQILASLPI